MERYKGVHGRERVRRITAALERSGATILSAPDPTIAPFVYRIRTPHAESLELICYAFTANKYRQGGRPTGEHRFQVKYGSEFDRAHEIYVDPTREKITLMFGVHDELPLFIAVDPVTHRTTWFSSSVEFKQHDLGQACAGVGWHGWERERTAKGRRQVDPREDLRVEAVLAFRPEHFLRYVELERVTSGLDPGERLLFIDKIGAQLAHTEPKAPRPLAFAHPLEQQLGLTAAEILEVIRGRGRLLTAVLGGVAEQHLERYLAKIPGVSYERIDRDGQPDFSVRYRARTRTVRIECKNVRARVASGNRPWVDFQKTRAAKDNPCSRYYAASQFEILAACLHPVTEQWEFKFRETEGLQPHKKCPGKLATNVYVEGSTWTPDLAGVLDRLTA